MAEALKKVFTDKNAKVSRLEKKERSSIHPPSILSFLKERQLSLQLPIADSFSPCFALMMTCRVSLRSLPSSPLDTLSNLRQFL